jgi:DNA polymerase-3 subunit epsilon
MIADFFVVDVETANQSRASICQIGIAAFAGGKMVDGWETLVNPEEHFAGINISIHGIRPEAVAHAPVWEEACAKVRELLTGAAVASHTDFDRGALNGACVRAALPAVAYGKWIDTCWLARRAWPNLPNHKLPNLAKHFGITYRAHDALEDARVAGEVLSLAMSERGVSIDELLAPARPHITGFPEPDGVKPALADARRRKKAQMGGLRVSVLRASDWE